jgi:hypothetical protein
VSNKNNNIRKAIKRPTAVWFGLLSIVWLQLAFAVHQFDHVADYVGDTCEVCVQLDRVDDVTVDHALPVAEIHTSASLLAPPSSRAATFGIVRGFHSRAPPFI